MRTIDPFLLPGLWSGGLRAERSTTMTAGRLPSPPERPVVIDHGRLKSLDATVMEGGFHAWVGRSGRRMICSVYPVKKTTVDKGLPDFNEAIIIAVRKRQTSCEAIEIFVVGAGIDWRRTVGKVLVEGAEEWHVHLPMPGMCAALLQEFAL